MKRKKIVHIVAHQGITPMVLGKNTIFCEGGEVFVHRMHTDHGVRVGTLKSGGGESVLQSMLQDVASAINEAHMDEHAIVDLRPHLNNPRAWIVKDEAHMDEHAIVDLRPYLNNPRAWIVKDEAPEE